MRNNDLKNLIFFVARNRMRDREKRIEKFQSKNNFLLFIYIGLTNKISISNRIYTQDHA